MLMSFKSNFTKINYFLKIKCLQSIKAIAFFECMETCLLSKVLLLFTIEMYPGSVMFPKKLVNEYLFFFINKTDALEFIMFISDMCLQIGRKYGKLTLHAISQVGSKKRYKNNCCSEVILAFGVLDLGNIIKYYQQMHRVSWKFRFEKQLQMYVRFYFHC